MLYGRDLLTLLDYTPEEIKYLIDLAIKFKKGEISPEQTKSLHGKVALLFFEKPSTRTRMSLEVAATQLGMHPMYVVSTTTQLTRGEPIEDFARVVDRYVDIITARVYSHESLEQLAQYAKAPVINALSDKYHPLQALADYMTILEKFGKIKGLKIAFVGDTDNNVAHSLAITGLKLGANIALVGPKKYWPSEEVLSELEELAKKYGGSILVTENPEEGVKDADVIYTDVWVSMGQEKEREERIKTLKPYQVNKDLTKFASKKYIFMHCLPRHREEEVSDDIFESEHSVVFDQAENRLHTAKAVFYALLSKS